MSGDRAFTENAAARGAPIVDLLDRRFAGFDAYRAEQLNRNGQPPWSDTAEQVANRWLHYELAPLPDGSCPAGVATGRRSGVGLDRRGGQLWCPTPVALPGADRPGHGTVAGRTSLLHGRHRPCPTAGGGPARLFLARDSDHGMLIRDPELGYITAIRTFVARCADRRA
jgi:hypothetical protein